MEIKTRKIWIDNVKIFACILVVLGHFFQSMTKADIMPTNSLYLWFNQTIYMFHVPLFFICSGYLYQKYTRVDSISAWKKNVWKKLITLGIPYVTFSLATWVLKTVFAGSVNEEIGGVVQILFVEPASPYWYLYCLFLLFLIIPTFTSRKVAEVGVGIAVLLKIFGSFFRFDIYAVSTIIGNGIWFVLGMYLCVIDFEAIAQSTRAMVIGIVLGVVFFVASILSYQMDINFQGESLILGLLACMAVVTIAIYVFHDDQGNRWINALAYYTLPIFVMHTIFAASLRSLLLKVGVTNWLVHMILGIGISFAGPIIATAIMKRFKWMEFFLYPGKILKLK